MRLASSLHTIAAMMIHSRFKDRVKLLDRMMARGVGRAGCAPVYTSHEGLSTQVPVGINEGLKHDRAIHCAELVSLPKSMLTNFIGRLSLQKLNIWEMPRKQHFKLMATIKTKKPLPCLSPSLVRC